MLDFQSLLPNWIDMSIEIAQQGGVILKEHWGKLQSIQEKGWAGDLITEVDRKSEDLIIQQIQKFFPSHSILAEESGQVVIKKEADFLWLVDPLDGTTNYTHQYPLVAVSLGLLYQGQPILGVVYNPIMEELYLAAHQLGATLNGASIKVSQVSSLPNSLLGTGFAYNRRETSDTNYAEFCYFTHLTQGVRRGGSAALDLAYVAAGRLDGYWEQGLKPWDIAAGIVLVKEAGGSVSDYDLNPLQLESGRILATNGFLQQTISQELTDLRKNIMANSHP